LLSGAVVVSRDKTHFSLSAAEYEQVRGGHLHARRRELVQRALLAQGDAVKTTLELGFGSGLLLAELAEQFPDVEFRGTEVESKMVAHAREHYRLPNLHYVLTDPYGEPQLPRAEFVFSIDVIHHIHAPLPFFQAIRDVLPQRGVWLVIEPNIYHPYIFLQQERMRQSGLDEDHFRPWALEPLLKQAGFAIERRRFVFLYPGWVPRITPLMARIERRIEGFPLLGGSVVYLLQAC
jgi:SAM-dependent methyltransferase